MRPQEWSFGRVFTARKFLCGLQSEAKLNMALQDPYELIVTLDQIILLSNLLNTSMLLYEASPTMFVPFLRLHYCSDTSLQFSVYLSQNPAIICPFGLFSVNCGYIWAGAYKG